ncbi:hypothetical protein SI65_07491 [Aspergillus cristatus]|uniref:AMP-dependent synthetase/ligase domain-containing protein n=1 Tax=Aspergillus cristatus TaxID=573508 RepID=A0A1E3B803_ASPCR|nr:hypothetical protein SI65_07491 [Aspergillus cristatus]
MGYIVSGLLAPLKGRFKAVVLSKYETRSVLHLVDKFRPTQLTLAKFAIQELIKYEGQVDLFCLASLMTGGYHMPYELIAAWKDRHNVPVYSSYGMRKLQPNVEAIVVSEKGQCLEVNQSEEFLFRSPFNMKMEGYYKDPQTTAATLTQDGWLKLRTSAGWMMRVTGISLVVPSHDEELMPRAYLVKEPGSKLTIETFLDWMDKECSPMTKLHGGAAFIDRIPITDSGHSKLDRKLLSDMAKRDLELK